MKYLSVIILYFYVLDRLLKLAAVLHFFHKAPPETPASWPSVTLIQPITQGASGLKDNLQARAVLNYPGPIQHLLICDTTDTATQTLCQQHLNEHSDLDSQIISTIGKLTPLASKIEKLNAALPFAHGDVLCFIDDDVAPRPDALAILIPYLLQNGVGAVFGLACYTNWETPWSSLMSLFVNSNALLSYIPLTYLIEPYTITGHFFALKQATLTQVDGFAGLDGRIDDDHELARRVRKAGLGCVQTPVIYDVNNQLFTFSDYMKQIHRWFVFPKQTLLPFLTRKEQLVSFLGSVGNLFPPLLLILALLTRREHAMLSTGISLGLFTGTFVLGERCYLRRRTPAKRWTLLPVVALFVPLQVLLALLTGNEIEWRGQRLRIKRGGSMELVRSTHNHKE